MNAVGITPLRVVARSLRRIGYTGLVIKNASTPVGGNGQIDLARAGGLAPGEYCGHMERTGWTAAELEQMTVSERYDLFMQFDDAPEIAFRVRNTLHDFKPNS